MPWTPPYNHALLFAYGRHEQSCQPPPVIPLSLQLVLRALGSSVLCPWSFMQIGSILSRRASCKSQTQNVFFSYFVIISGLGFRSGPFWIPGFS